MDKKELRRSIRDQKRAMSEAEIVPCWSALCSTASGLLCPSATVMR